MWGFRVTVKVEGFRVYGGWGVHLWLWGFQGFRVLEILSGLKKGLRTFGLSGFTV